MSADVPILEDACLGSASALGRGALVLVRVVESSADVVDPGTKSAHVRFILAVDEVAHGVAPPRIEAFFWAPAVPPPVGAQFIASIYGGMLAGMVAAPPGREREALAANLRALVARGPFVGR